ncbi:Rhomboid-like protein 14, mitochondrial [Dionaea muscipula]
MERGGGRFSRGMLPLLAFNVVSEYYRLERKPPVTAGLIAANTIIYLRPSFLKSIIPSIDEVWFNAFLILKNRDLKRYFLSPFYHMGESHLVYNMLSLLWKGIQLETSMGSVEFASMVSALLVLSQGITLLLAEALLVFFDYQKAFYSEYAVGFSGVLFAMKVVLNSQSDNYTYVQGFLVPTRYAAWAELILIQMFVPGVSFLGHLGGILAGMLYIHLKKSHSGPNPLTKIFRAVSRLVSWPLRFIRGLLGSGEQRNYGRGAVGTRTAETVVWRCGACTYDNSSLLTVCEMCGTGRGRSPMPSHQFNDLTLEELRNRRIHRFAGH